MIKAHLFLIGVFAIFAFSCVEPFNFPSLDHSREIVVEGRFTDMDKGHFVKLSYTRPIDRQRNDPLAGATVWVEGADGSRIDFTETSPGYYTCTEGIAGEAGIKYQLLFKTADGGAYQSNQQELIPSPPIDSIYHAYAEKASSTSGEVKKGIQFFVDTHDDTNRAKYYKYDLEETWEVNAYFPSMYVFSPDPDTVLPQMFDTSPCYVTSKINGVIIGTTADLTMNRLSEMPVRLITGDTDHLRVNYSLLAKQFAISREAYSFYKKLLENNQDNESMFNKQLGAVVGNIYATDNDGETVLGYFEVAGVSEKRIFVKFQELDRRFSWPQNQFPCNPDEIVNVGIDSVKYYAVGREYGIISAGYKDGSLMASLAPKFCTDCRFRGPANKPDFWIY